MTNISLIRYPQHDSCTSDLPLSSPSPSASAVMKKPAEVTIDVCQQEEARKGFTIKPGRRSSIGRRLAEDMRLCILGPSKCANISSSSSSSSAAAAAAAANEDDDHHHSDDYSFSTSVYSPGNIKTTGGSVYQDLLQHHNEMMTLGVCDMKGGDDDDNDEQGNQSGIPFRETRRNSLPTTFGSSSIHSVQSHRSVQLPYYPKIVEDEEEDTGRNADDREEEEESNTMYKLKRCHNDEYNGLYSNHQRPRIANGTCTASVMTDNITYPTNLTTGISSFYLSALEEAALTEEEEEELLLAKSQSRSESIDDDEASFGEQSFDDYSCNNDFDDAGDGNIPIAPPCKKSLSTFYQSALDVATSAESLFDELSEGDVECCIASEEVDEERSSTTASLSSSMSSRVNNTLHYTPTRSYRSIDDDNVDDYSTFISPNLIQSSTAPFNETSFPSTSVGGEESSSTNGPKLNSIDTKKYHVYNTNHYGVEDEDEDLRMVLELSLHEAVSSTHSDGVSSCSLFTLEENRNTIISEDNSCNVTLDHEENNDDDDDAFLISQLEAMEEYQKKSQDNNTTRSFSPLTNRRRLSAPVISTRTRSMSLRSSYSDAIPSSSLPGGETRRRRQSLLETKGETETRVSISDGTSHSVKCQGCNRRLLAPMNYSLVFCPKCRIVSPV